MITPIPYADLRAFSRVAVRLLADPPANAGGSRALRGRAGAGLEFLDHRDYLPGDELRRVDWRQSARQQRMIVRRFQLEASTDWYLCLDASSSMAASGSGKWQLAVHCATAMAFVLLDMGHRVGILLFADDIVAGCPPGRGFSHYLRVSQTLQNNQPRTTGASSRLGACLARIRGRASAFVISDFLTADRMQRDLSALRSTCSVVHALHVSSEAEARMDGIGHVTLVDRETGARLDAVAHGAPEPAALAVMRQIRSELQAFCRAGALPCSCWDSAQDWRRVLVGHLSAARLS